MIGLLDFLSQTRVALEHLQHDLFLQLVVDVLQGCFHLFQKVIISVKYQLHGWLYGRKKWNPSVKIQYALNGGEISQMKY